MPKIDSALCPYCHQTSCYHCWDCGVVVSEAPHKKTCEHYRPPNSCKACGGTGKNTYGGPCFPCVEHGRIEPF